MQVAFSKEEWVHGKLHEKIPKGGLPEREVKYFTSKVINAIV
jgi:hypothetical protein